MPDEPEPTAGRVLVLAVSDGRLQLVAEAQTKGAVYSLTELRGRIVAGVNNRIEVYGWDDSGTGGALAGGSSSGAAASQPGVGVLRCDCYHHGHILALCVEARGDFIVVGDLMKSVSLHIFRPDTCEIEDLARDYNSNWVTTLDILDDDTFVAADSSFNLFTVRKNAEASNEEERQRLEVCGEYHLGEFVNRFRRGALTMQLADADSPPLPTLLFGTVNGVIGVIATLPVEVSARRGARAGVARASTTARTFARQHATRCAVLFFACSCVPSCS
jgi:DNA damage-binding protein 1